MEKKVILILGAGIMQIPAVKIAKEKGWKVICADGNPDAEGRSLADSFYNIDLKDLDGLLSLGRELTESVGLDGVFTVGTDFSVSVAHVAENLRLPGITRKCAERATDKVLMRRCFRDHNVSSPRFIELEEGSTLVPEEVDLTWPLVVKPVDNMGARGVMKIGDPGLWEASIRKAFGYSRSGRVIVEEFIGGEEYSLDAVVENGNITICGFADRHIFYSPYFIEMGHTLPSAAGEEIRERIEQVFRDGIRAIGIDNGAAKGDLKWNGSRAVVGEIAARLSGGYMSGWTFPYACGISAVEAAMNIAVGLPAGNLSSRTYRVSAERAVISVPGTVISTEGEKEARDVRFVKDLFIRVSPGSCVVFPTNNVEKCANIITTAENREDAVSAAEECVSRLWFRLAAGDPATAKFLNGHPDWVPDAFTGLSPAAEKWLTLLKKRFGGDFRKYRFPPENRIPVWPGWEKESVSDWNHRPLPLVMTLIEKHSLVVFYTEENPSGVSDFAVYFWRALLRGSVQGAVWFLESCLRDLDHPAVNG